MNAHNSRSRAARTKRTADSDRARSVEAKNEVNRKKCAFWRADWGQKYLRWGWGGKERAPVASVATGARSAKKNRPMASGERQMASGKARRGVEWSAAWGAKKV